MCTIEQAAEELLVKLGALDKPSSLGNEPPSINTLGRTMSQFPLAPRYAKMLALGGQADCLEYVIALVAGLSVREVFISDSGSCDNEQVCCQWLPFMFFDVLIYIQETEKSEKKQNKVYSTRRGWAGQVHKYICTYCRKIQCLHSLVHHLKGLSKSY